MKKSHMAQNVIHEIENLMPQSTGLQSLEQRPVLLKMREDEQKLSFSKRIGVATAGSSNYASKNAPYSSNLEYDRGSQPTREQTHGIHSNIEVHHYD